MTERFELMKKALSQMLEERKYAALRDVMETMYPADIAAVFADLQTQRLPVIFRLLPKELAAETFAEMRRDFPECITVCHVMKEEDIRLAFRHPNVMLASDGLVNNGQGHPRAAGSFTRFLKEFARTGTLSLYQAIEKMTAIPADRLHLAAKGRLNVGADADITVFDYGTVSDNATFAQPALEPTGIEYVFVGGELALEKGRILKDSCGKAIRK